MTVWDEKMELERGCQIELRKQKINGTAEFRKWAVKNHPDKGGKLKVFQKVSGCVDVVFKGPETEQPPSTSYSPSRPPPPGKKFRSRHTSRTPPPADFFWSAFDEHEVDEDFLFGRPPPRRNAYSEGVRSRRARSPPEEFRSRKRERAYEKRYGFRGDPDGFTSDNWDEFEEYVNEHFSAREKRGQAAELRRQERRKERRKERERQKKSEEESRKWRGTSPREWTGPSNPYQAPESSEAQARAPREQGAHTPWSSRQWAKEAAQRMRRAFYAQKWSTHPGDRTSWRHRLSRPQVAFMVVQLTCMQSVFLSTAFRAL